METPDPDPYASIISLMTSIIFLGFDANTVFSLLALLILLAISAMISGSETAFFSLKPADLNVLKEEVSEQNKKVLHLREIPKTLLATILIVNNLVNVSIVILSSYITFKLFDFSQNELAAFFIQVVVITSLILIFGEIVPKIYANKKPLHIAQMMAPLLMVFIYIFKPLSATLVGSISFLDKHLANKTHSLTMSELSAAIDITSDETTPPAEKKMLKGIATFGEKEVRSVMKSRVDISAIDVKASFEKLIDVVLNSGYSRIPVFEGNLDKIMGILYIKDLIPFLSNDDIEWKKLIRPAFFVPENKKINDLLQEFRQKKIHMAIVVDEYGGTAGLLTLEDIIEEIVGDISDEFDKVPDDSFYKKTGQGIYVFEGRTNLVDFIKVMDLEDHYFENVQGDSDTLAGLLLELEGRIPENGVQVKCKGFLFEVVDADTRRIKQIKVTYSSNDV
ncbi:MAG: gliding motility-associated protein GldE [Bacteroidales bacterium]|nr:gliding motility-associated protein GldE [Bacteroidales bacterium]MDP2235753.1 gliding motility-associated protein GldE [Bacteroidales bacterium]